MKVFFDIFGKILYYGSIGGFVWFTFTFKHKPYHALYLFLKDLKHIDKEIFPLYGVHFYVNSMGSGKTISVTEKALRLREKYPKLWIVSNYEITVADDYFSDYETLLNMKNPNGSEYGLLVLFDEIHLTFASDNWKNAPADLLDYIAMRRKEKTLILGTSQVFGRIDKKLREQCTVVIECVTYLNRWTFNKAYRVEDYLVNGELKDSGQKKRRRLFRYNFVQTNNIRQAYDSYALVEKINLKPRERRYIDLDSIENIEVE